MAFIQLKGRNIKTLGRDYRRLNAQTVPDTQFPELSTSMKFSKINLVKVFYQMLIAEEHKAITVLTPLEPYKSNIMSFGFRNAPSKLHN